MTIKIKNYLTNNSVYYSKSFISNDIVKKCIRKLLIFLIIFKIL